MSLIMYEQITGLVIHVIKQINIIFVNGEKIRCPKCKYIVTLIIQVL